MRPLSAQTRPRSSACATRKLMSAMSLSRPRTASVVLEGRTSGSGSMAGGQSSGRRAAMGRVRWSGAAQDRCRHQRRQIDVKSPQRSFTRNDSCCQLAPIRKPHTDLWVLIERCSKRAEAANRDICKTRELVPRLVMWRKICWSALCFFSFTATD